MKNIKTNNLSLLLSKVFNKPNINKILIIFLVGFISRIFINYIFDINVFVNCLSKISIFYFMSISMFTAVIHEVISYHINIVPSFSFMYRIYKCIVTKTLDYIVGILISLNIRIYFYKLEDIKIHPLIKRA